MLKSKEDLEKMSVTQLKELAFALDEFVFSNLRLGEPYSPLYRKNRKFFKVLVRRTLKLRNNIRRFFKEQATRKEKLVNLYKFTFAEEDDIDRYINIESWEQEDDELIATVNIDIAALFDIGALTTEMEENQAVDVSSQESAAQKFLRDYTMEMVKDINEVTRKRIIEQLRTSIAAGENRDQASERIDRIIDNPKRSTTIAQTESVRAYSEGRMEVLERLGYKSKIWVGPQAGDKNCPHGEIKKLRENFSNGKLFPPGHPNCRCGYRQTDTLTPADIDSIVNYAK